MPRSNRLVVSLLILLCSLLITNVVIMVRKPVTTGVVAPVTVPSVKDHKSHPQAPEDSSMKKGLFQEGNTQPPTETSILPLFSLEHKTAVVSGSDRGIGLAVAQALAEAGANVAIWYHSNEKAHERAKEISENYGVKCTLPPSHQPIHLV